MAREWGNKNDNVKERGREKEGLGCGEDSPSRKPLWINPRQHLLFYLFSQLNSSECAKLHRKKNKS